ncbi:MAG: TFIIB-type zinc ribbon-containing protein [Promethearchaeota archaeon]
MRCPKCGNEVNKEDFVCIYCSAKLKEETIEKIKLFRRIEDKWTNPESKWKRFQLVFYDPSRAFWDMSHYRQKIGSGKIYSLTALLFGLFGLAIFSHLKTDLWMPPLSIFFNGLALFMMFFLFGLIYYLVFYLISIKLFSFGANQSINLSKQLKLRYGRGDENKTGSEVEKESPNHLKTQESKKTSIMLYGFSPMLIGLGISALIAWFGLPNVVINGPYDFAPEKFQMLFASYVWGIIDWIQVIIIIGWVPILMSIALRDIANASTARVYISCVVVSVFISWIFFFSRPTFLFTHIL